MNLYINKENKMKIYLADTITRELRKYKLLVNNNLDSFFQIKNKSDFENWFIFKKEKFNKSNFKNDLKNK